jgi:hypothetical protein
VISVLVVGKAKFPFGLPLNRAGVECGSRERKYRYGQRNTLTVEEIQAQMKKYPYGKRFTLPEWQNTRTDKETQAQTEKYLND